MLNRASWFRQEIMKVREVIPHTGPIPIVIPLKLFLDLLRDPIVCEIRYSHEGSLIANHMSSFLPMLTAERIPTQ